MTTPKGYPCQRKEDRLSAEFATIQPVTPNRFGLETVANCFAFQVATDTADSSTTTVITAAAHKAIKGDIIKWTSGAMDDRMFTVWDTDTNTITLSQTMDSAPAAGSAFTILRYSPGLVSATGSSTAAITFTRDGVASEVIEDTVTPANNRPLPVKLQDFSGDMVLNATNLNLEVQLDHDSAEPDSIQIGDGTETLSITAAGKAEVDPGYSLGAGVVGAAVLRTTPASDSPHLLATRHEAAATPVAVRISDGSAFSIPTPKGRVKADGPWRNDYTSTGVTTAAYVEIDASTAADINRLQIFDSSGQTMALATGAGGAEVDVVYVSPGGIDLDYYIPAGTRISIKAISANATVGEIVINALQ